MGIFLARLCLVFIAIAGSSAAAAASEIRVLAVVIYKSCMADLVAEFQRKTGHNVDALVLNPVPLRTKYLEGEAFDVIMTIAPMMDDFISSGNALGGTRRTVGRSGIGVAVRAGAQRPDIGSRESLVAALKAAPSIGFSTGPRGVYVEGMLGKLSIENSSGTKFRKVTGEPVAAPVSRGELAIGMQQLSELLGQPGIDVVGPLPKELQHHTIVDGAIHPKARNPQVAEQFLAFLKSAEAVAIINRAGIDSPLE